MASTVQQPEPPAADRMELVRAAAAWLTADSVAAIGRGMAASIVRHRRVTGRQPTWAEALAGVDRRLLTPIMTVPEDWPLPAAVWRRELRGRLMSRLRLARWVSFTAAPRSLRVGARGRAWLTGRAGDGLGRTAGTGAAVQRGSG